MMKLRNLFDNRDLAMMLLQNWDYDHENISIMNYFRISANAVYPFMSNGLVNFLRFSPVEEKSGYQLKAELDFLTYLHENNYPAVKIVQSKSNKTLIIADTPWGKYNVSVFKGVNGKQLEALSYSDELYYGLGQSLGILHNLSSKYKPKITCRLDWKERLSWIKSILLEYSASKKALDEVDILYRFFEKLPINAENYGLIHYDFELDNVFYDENTKTYAVIDFDDSIYHWFIMDIAKTIDSINEELPEYSEQAVQYFLNGYRSEMKFDDEIFSYLAMFKRYADLFSYARIIRSTYEKWENEPEWMQDLRKNLQYIIMNKSKAFGTKII